MSAKRKIAVQQPVAVIADEARPQARIVDGAHSGEGAASPARQYQAMLEAALTETAPKYPMGVRFALMAGSSLLLWGMIGWAVTLAFR